MQIPTIRNRLLNQSSVIIGYLLRDMRKAKGISQEELAQRIGSTQARISNYEQGYTQISAWKLERLLEGLDSDDSAFAVQFYQHIITYCHNQIMQLEGFADGDTKTT